MVENLLYSDDVQYMLAALRTLGLNVEDDSDLKRAVVGGCGGHFPAGESSDEVKLFLGNAGTAMRPLTAAVTAAGGNSRFFEIYQQSSVLFFFPKKFFGGFSFGVYGLKSFFYFNVDIY